MDKHACDCFLSREFGLQFVPPAYHPKYFYQIGGNNKVFTLDWNCGPFNEDKLLKLVTLWKIDGDS